MTPEEEEEFMEVMMEVATDLAAEYRERAAAARAAKRHTAEAECKHRREKDTQNHDLQLVARRGQMNRPAGSTMVSVETRFDEKRFPKAIATLRR